MSCAVLFYLRRLLPLLLISGSGGALPAFAAGPSQSELDAGGKAADSWLMTNKSYDGRRYVDLRQIEPGNVTQLKEVCTFDSGVAAPAQSAPLLYEGRIYFSVGATTLAIDAATCREIWRHEWTLKGKALSNPNRGVAIKEGRVVRGTPDGFLIALDMADGKLIWERQITSAQEGHYLSMPAMIVDDVIVYGTAGADWGGRGWFGAFKLENGEELWRFDTLPKPGEPEAESWGAPEALAHGGGSFWTPVSVDREKNLVYIAVGNPAPDFFGGVRQGANLYTNSLVALDLKTGKPVWWKQFVPHDERDWDLSQVSPLFAAEFQGKLRNMIAVSGKDGRLRLVDRDTHEILADIPISKQENTETPVTVEGVHICPGLLGGQEWSSSAYDPGRKIVISPMVNWCGTAHRNPEAPVWKVGEHYYGGKIDQDPIDQARGVLAATDVSLGELRWKAETEAPMLANVTATASGVIFAGDLKGNLYAVSSGDGSLLWRHQLGASAGGGLFTYELNGKQYVAVVFGPVSAFFGGGTGTAKLKILALP